MKTKQIKVSELSGSALDWCVALAEGWKVEDDFWITDPSEPGTGQPLSDYSPSTEWEQGGPIIEREGIAVGKSWEGWKAFTETSEGEGPTPLIAAMRCFVASKLGDSVSIPLELLEV
jgi:hypothetical protein